MITHAELIDAIIAAENGLMTAGYIDNFERCEHEKQTWRTRLAQLRSTMIPHDRSATAPVLPGTAVMIRIDPNATLVQSHYPERIDWREISEWQPKW